MEWRSTQFLILGLGRSGRGAIDLLLRFGGQPAGYDRTPPGAADAKQFAAWEEEGARFFYGEPDEALLNDIDIVVVSPGLTTEHTLVAAAKERGIPVISEIELAYRAADCPIIAVTGTNGKSTTTSLIGEIMKREGRRVAVAGNIGRPLTDVVGPHRDYDLIVAEISSFQLETIDRFRPKTAVLLNLTDDHLDRHGSFENYASIKARLFENQDETDAAILNYDDPAVRRIGNTLKSRVLWFSREVGGNLPGVSLTYGEIRSKMDDEEELVGLERDIAIPGPHNRMNALASVAAAKVMDVPNKV
ncbi:MAG: UDP-N-acetylmuramoyl-L-alanine--D-glutamate ligase, partial [Gemmatimonadetes bacterium]|nr:UDP-N-acetylmuramoyl-L-alanine--D-glutamate ligase [Gemmatimonadota bacterium]